MYARARLRHVRFTSFAFGPLRPDIRVNWWGAVYCAAALSPSIMALNGSISYPSPILDLLDPTPNGFDDPPIELLEAELPVVDDGQVQLSDLVSRVVQACYAEMTEMAET